MHILINMHTKILSCLPLLLASAGAAAQTPIGASVVLPEVVVRAPGEVEALPTGAASERRVSGETLNTRPITRPGEALEAAPGLIVTQHSGEGKANQYFLRGFNLDHGTDLALWLDGMPLNMRTHGHGQGYADINFLIPELVQQMVVRKGPYWADEGDFGSAGSVHLSYANRLENKLVSVTGGSFGYWRGLAAGSFALGDGAITAAGELVRYDGPWQTADATRKYNGFLRYSEGNAANGFAITALAYTNSWHSTDQIPARAVFDGSLDRFGSVDPTDGGDAQRHSLSARWSRSDERTTDKVEGYFVHQTLNLYNNFTYSLDDPDKGDQFQQSDKRRIMGLNASRAWRHPLVGFEAETKLGLQVRHDDIDVGLFKSVQRTAIATTRNDKVDETSVGLYGENRIKWTDWLRSTLGLRGDVFRANVASDTAANSGQIEAFIASPKAGLVFGPFATTEIFVNGGLGFHSNDARGATIAVDPGDKVTPQQRVPLLVRSRGAEVGVRTRALDGLDSSVALFLLEFDSEILFQGDAGTTAAGRPSRRVGVEWTNHYRPLSWAMLDLDLAYTQARFTDHDVAGDRIPGAPSVVASAGVILGDETGWFGGLRWRYFGPRPLIEDDSARSAPTSLFNARLGYVFEDGLKLQLDVLNLLNTKASQVDYHYTSHLPGEDPAGVADRHFHPVEPLAFRVTVAKSF